MNPKQRAETITYDAVIEELQHHYNEIVFDVAMAVLAHCYKNLDTYTSPQSYELDGATRKRKVYYYYKN